MGVHACGTATGMDIEFAYPTVPHEAALLTHPDTSPLAGGVTQQPVWSVGVPDVPLAAGGGA